MVVVNRELVDMPVAPCGACGVCRSWQAVKWLVVDVRSVDTGENLGLFSGPTGVGPDTGDKTA